MASFGRFRYSNDGVNWHPRDVAAVPDTLPTVPRTVTATANSYSQITVAWTAPLTVGGMVAYQVRYKAGSAPTGPTDGTFLGNTTSLSYVHTGLSSSTTYGYYVFGITGDGQNGPGAGATATTPVGIPTAPLNVRITAAAYNSLTVAWDAPSAPGGLTAYQVRYDANRIPTNGSDGTFVTNTTGLSASAGTNESTYYGFYVAGYIADGTQGPGGTTAYTTPARPTSSGTISSPGQCGGCYMWKQSSAVTTSSGFTFPVNGYVSQIDFLCSGYGATGRINPYCNGAFKGERDVGSTGAGSPGWTGHGMGNQYLGASSGYTCGFSNNTSGSYKTQWGYYTAGGSNSVCFTLYYWWYTASRHRKDGSIINEHVDSWLDLNGDIEYQRFYDRDTGEFLEERGERSPCIGCGDERRSGNGRFLQGPGGTGWERVLQITSPGLSPGGVQ